VTAAPATRSATSPVTGGGTFTGTRPLLRLALRRDRVKLPVWLAAVAVFHLVSARSVLALYPEAHDRVRLAVTSAVSSVAVVFNGLVSGTSPGAAVMSQTLLPTTVAAGFMNYLLVARHTRQNEETGRQELLAAGVLGRRAALTAALLLALGADVVLCVLNLGVLVVAGLPAGPALLAAAAISVAGLVLGAVAGVTAQVWESTRAAAAAAGAVLAVAFGLRAYGDTAGELVRHGTAIRPGPGSRLSPLGWAELARPFDADQWRWLLPGLVLSMALAVVAFALVDRRDVGAGLFQPRTGRPRATAFLGTPVGLAWRLQRTSLTAWAAGLAVTGLATGAGASQADSLLGSSKETEQMIRDVAGGAGVSLADAYVGATFTFLGAVVAALGLLTVLRLHSEEADGHAEALLATGVGRVRWAMATVLVGLAAVLGALVVCGAVTGLAWSLTSDVGAGALWRVTSAALAQAPVALALTAFGLLAFGLAGRAAATVSWSLFAACVVLGPLGSLLGLPAAVVDLSPLAHSPAAPAVAASAGPQAVLCLVAVVLAGAGLGAFRRRDLDSR